MMKVIDDGKSVMQERNWVELVQVQFLSYSLWVPIDLFREIMELEHS